jgi:hypothetical protein
LTDGRFALPGGHPEAQVLPCHDLWFYRLWPNGGLSIGEVFHGNISRAAGVRMGTPAAT